MLLSMCPLVHVFEGDFLFSINLVLIIKVLLCFVGNDCNILDLILSQRRSDAAVLMTFCFTCFILLVYDQSDIYFQIYTEDVFNSLKYSHSGQII